MAGRLKMISKKNTCSRSAWQETLRLIRVVEYMRAAASVIWA